MKKIFIVLAIALIQNNIYSQCACCSGASMSFTNTLLNNGSLTLPKNNFFGQLNWDYRAIESSNSHHHHNSSDTSMEEETPLSSMLIHSVDLRYGLSNRITLSVILPYVSLYTSNGNDNGLGDLSLLGTFSIFQKKQTNIALQVGIELPTGIQKGANFDNTTVVIGSGSYDPILGILFSKKWNRSSLLGQALYKHTTKGFEGNYYGSLALQNITYSYQINPVMSCDTSNTRNKFIWNISGGLNSEWIDKIIEDNQMDENSGYFINFATLGASVTYRNWSIPLTFSLPIYQKVNGHQNNTQFRLKFGIAKLF